MLRPRIQTGIYMDPAVYLITLPFQILIALTMFVIRWTVIGCYLLLRWLAPVVGSALMWSVEKGWRSGKSLCLYIKEKAIVSWRG